MAGSACLVGSKKLSTGLSTGLQFKPWSRNLIEMRLVSCKQSCNHCRRDQDVDDFIILRADGTPTYLLAVVVDDHDMGVTQALWLLLQIGGPFFVAVLRRRAL